MIRAVFDPTAIWNEPLFCYHVSKFIRIKLSKSSLLGDMDLLAAGELELGPVESLKHMLLILQLGEDGHHDLARVDPGHWALGLSKSTSHTCVEPRVGGGCMSIMNVPWKGLSPRSLRQQATYTTKDAAVCNHCTFSHCS